MANRAQPPPAVAAVVSPAAAPQVASAATLNEPSPTQANYMPIDFR